MLLVCTLLYGSGLRLLECLHLRVKDIDFERNEIAVRDGKGRKDRVTTLPASCKQQLLAHLKKVGQLHQDDLRQGLGRAPLPDAVARKYPSADRQWAWQYVFPASSHYTDRLTGIRHRHHLHETVVQKAMAAAVRLAGLKKPATPHTLRHSFRNCDLEDGLCQIDGDARIVLHGWAPFCSCPAPTLAHRCRSSRGRSPSHH